VDLLGVCAGEPLDALLEEVGEDRVACLRLGGFLIENLRTRDRASAGVLSAGSNPRQRGQAVDLATELH